MAVESAPSSHREEPWLRGPIAGVHPFVAPTIHAFIQAREDVALWSQGLSDEQVWIRPFGLAPVGFHLRHIAGSVERLTCYLKNEQLTPEQLDAVRHEMDPGAPVSQLLNNVNQALQESEQILRALDVTTLSQARTVGRKRLATTVMGLVVHLAEHTQRHVGELIVTTKLARTAEHGRTSQPPS